MNTLLWVLFGLVLYTFLATLLKARGYIPESVKFQGPITTVHTARGRAFLERLARPKRLWRAWTNFGLGVTLVVMVGSFFFLIQAAVLAITRPELTVISEPRNVLVIPGVNDFLPLSVAPEIVLGLLVGLVVHEGGHGVLCRVEGISIKSMGLAFLAIVPVGAFVEPDEDSQRNANRGGRSRMFAAGVTNNFAITLVAFALLFGPVVGSIGVASGAAVGGVLPGSAADAAGIADGDRIVGVAGTPVESNDDLTALLRSNDADTVSVTLDDGRSVDVTRRVLVTGAPGDGVVEGIPVDRDDPAVITAVNGEPVSTEAGFRAALGDADAATLTVAHGGTEDQVELPVGSYVLVTPDDPLNAAGAPLDTGVVITELAGERVTSTSDLSEVLDGTTAGETVSVAAYVDGERRTYSVTLSQHPEESHGFLGVRPLPGVTGITVSDFGVELYPAEQYLGVLGGTGDDPFTGSAFLSRIYLALLLPIAGMGAVSFLPYNFAGFTGPVANFFVVDGPLAVLGGGVFLTANVLFWIGWINLNLGFFNCIPAYPLDGGRILRTSTEAVVSRLPVGGTHELTRTITVTVGVTMGASLLVMIFGPTFLG